MKRTVVKLEVELEGPMAAGDNLRHWLLDRVPSDDTFPEDRFRILHVSVLEEDRA